MKRNREIYLLGLMFVLSFLMHFRVFPLDIISFHSWRQTQTQTTINNFYEEDFNILNPRENNRGNTEGFRRMEFPVMQWLIAGTYKLIGSNSILITRVISFILGLLSTFGIYKLVNLLIRAKYSGIIGAFTFLLSPVVFYYYINPMPDNFALSCGIFGIYFFFRYYKNQKLLEIVFCGFFLSVSALSKLPFIIYFAIPITYYILKLFRKKLHQQDLKAILIGLFFLALPAVWYINVIPTWQGNVVAYGLFHNNYDLALLFDYLQHNLISTLPEMLIGYASFPLFVAAIYFIVKHKAYRNEVFIILSVCGFFLIAYYLYEINLIEKVHDYYLMPYLPLLFILVSYGATKLLERKDKYKWVVLFLLMILPVTTWARMKGRWDEEEPGFNKDLITHRSELSAIGNEEDLCVVGNDPSRAIWFYYLDKKGWGFDSDKLTPTKLNEIVEKGGKYLFTDSDIVANNKSLSVHYDSLILKKGSIYVILLK